MVQGSESMQIRRKRSREQRKTASLHLVDLIFKCATASWSVSITVSSFLCRRPFLWNNFHSAVWCSTAPCATSGAFDGGNKFERIMLRHAKVFRARLDGRRWPANDNVNSIKRIVIRHESGLLHVQAIEGSWWVLDYLRCWCLWMLSQIGISLMKLHIPPFDLRVFAFNARQVGCCHCEG